MKRVIVNAIGRSAMKDSGISGLKEDGMAKVPSARKVLLVKQL